MTLAGPIVLVYDGGVEELQRVVDQDAAEVARRVILRHKFGRLSDRRILMLLRSCPVTGEVANLPDKQLLDLWFGAFARHVEQLRPSPS